MATQITTPVWYGPAPSNTTQALDGAWVVRHTNSRGKIIARFPADGRDQAEAWVNRHCWGASCEVLRTALRTTSHYNMVTGERSGPIESTWVTEPCGTPLFLAHEKAARQCRSCQRGWNHPNNYRADGPRPTVEEG